VSYQVGIDLGTTYTAAAVHRDGIATIFSLGTRSAAIPSIVLLRADGTVLTGDAAERRALTEPERVVREFKRRLGDTIPIIVGGSPYSAEALSARLLESVLEEIYKREGGEPSRISVSHPANWGNYKRDLLQQAIRLAGLDLDKVGLITEPEAAALSYAAQERVEPGDVVAVYDLGGGTFDAAVMRRTVNGFTILGKPEGIERLGGIDFDAAVFAHVSSGLGDALTELDQSNATSLAAVARLRQDCVEAKEALSSDTDTSIPVMLPNLQTEVRLTRREFETLIRPSLLDSIEAMRRAVDSADITFDDVSKVLLVGGSSRIPLIAQLVSSQLGRPVGVDAHPKHAVAIGASLAASGLLERAAAAAGAEKTGGVPLDPLVTVVAPAEMLAKARQPAGHGGSRPAAPSVPAVPGPGKAQPVPSADLDRFDPVSGRGSARSAPPGPPGGPTVAPASVPAVPGPGRAQPVPSPDLDRFDSLPDRGSARSPAPAPPSGRDAASPSVPVVPGPGKAQPVPSSLVGPPPGGPEPASGRSGPPGKAQPVPDPGPPPSTGSHRVPGPTAVSPAASQRPPSPRPAPPPIALPETEPTTLYRPDADPERTSVMHPPPGGNRRSTTPYPPGTATQLNTPNAYHQSERSKRRRSRGGVFVVVLVLVALAVAGVIIVQFAS
jgi:actin-like ATPase involved in cell morphogenesis